MKFHFLYLALLLCFAACDPEPDCNCKSYEDCIDGECVLQPNTYLLGTTAVSGENMYVGFAEGNSCVDTVLFFVKPDNQFSLYVNAPPVMNVGPAVVDQQSATEFWLSVGAPLCRNPNKYANIACTVKGDTVDLRLFFYTLDQPNVYTDSVDVRCLKHE